MADRVKTQLASIKIPDSHVLKITHAKYGKLCQMWEFMPIFENIVLHYQYIIATPLDLALFMMLATLVVYVFNILYYMTRNLTAPTTHSDLTGMWTLSRRAQWYYI